MFIKTIYVLLAFSLIGCSFDTETKSQRSSKDNSTSTADMQKFSEYLFQDNYGEGLETSEAPETCCAYNIDGDLIATLYENNCTEGDLPPETARISWSPGIQRCPLSQGGTDYPVGDIEEAVIDVSCEEYVNRTYIDETNNEMCYVHQQRGLPLNSPNPTSCQTVVECWPIGVVERAPPAPEEDEEVAPPAPIEDSDIAPPAPEEESDYDESDPFDASLEGIEDEYEGY